MQVALCDQVDRAQRADVEPVSAHVGYHRHTRDGGTLRHHGDSPGRQGSPSGTVLSIPEFGPLLPWWLGDHLIRDDAGRLADLDQVAIGVSDISADFGAVVLWLSEEHSPFG
jgi:hypothetical protein